MSTNIYVSYFRKFLMRSQELRGINGFLNYDKKIVENLQKIDPTKKTLPKLHPFQRDILKGVRYL